MLVFRLLRLWWLLLGAFKLGYCLNSSGSLPEASILVPEASLFEMSASNPYELSALMFVTPSESANGALDFGCGVACYSLLI